MHADPHVPTRHRRLTRAVTVAFVLFTLTALTVSTAGAAPITGPPVGPPPFPPGIGGSPCELAAFPCRITTFTFTYHANDNLELEASFPNTPKALSNKITVHYDLHCDDNFHVVAVLKPIAANAQNGLAQGTQLRGEDLVSTATTSCTITQTLWGAWVTAVDFQNLPFRPPYGIEQLTFTNTRRHWPLPGQR